MGERGKERELSLLEEGVTSTHLNSKMEIQAHIDFILCFI